ncbi:NAD(P)-dependent oxidoreductase [Sediminibacterium sp.]|uniref:NAD-dependent epimerase/dehydratase family protein n=1 Tax=Sediminibacterium sp. TaxID=1917865 RepID=UPI002731143A|nr:NAD(P)-dependent oxidoreductase [Sediminibacterium sp.]MDP2420242.1 NAD(P)-dependent oxidoreductase [Sediminibacterium sp.]
MLKKILVTGSTGFVGRHLIPKLVKSNYEILEITRSISNSTKLFGVTTLKVEVDDVLLKEKINHFKPDIVVHLASYLTSSDLWDDVEELIKTNILYLAKILNAISETGLKLFINTGTFAEYYYGDDVLEPAYFYAATKTASRSLVDYYSKAFNFKQATVVPYTIYGENDTQKKIIDIILDSTVINSPIDLTPGNQVLDFIHIDDVIDFYLLLIQFENRLEKKSNFKLGTGSGHSIKQVAQIIENISGRNTNINWGGKPYRKTDVMYAIADIDLQKKMFNWEPKITLNEGIRKLIKAKK